MASLSLIKYTICSALFLLAQVAIADPHLPSQGLWPGRSTDQALQHHAGVVADDISNKTAVYDGQAHRIINTTGGSWWTNLLGASSGALPESSAKLGVESNTADGESANPSRPLRVCIMTGDVYGTSEMGGTATAFWHLSNLLRNGMQPAPEVTWIALETPIQAANCTQLKPLYISQGFQIVCLEGARSWSTNPFRQAGWNALLWLRTQEPGICDVLHSHEWGGVLHSVIQAKLLGEFPLLHINIVPHGGHMWSRDTAWTATNAIDKEVDTDERFVLENADSVVSPNKYMVDYLRRDRGWQLKPATTWVIGNIQSASAFNTMGITKDSNTLAGLVQSEVQYKPFTNVVFFGRLEARKGLHVFISAVGSIPKHNDPTFKVSFIGSDPTKKRSSLLAEIKDKWRCQVNVLIGLAQHEALAQLKALSQQGGVLVVMPSVIDNQPFTVAEVALAGLPMLAFDVGGIGEMLSSATRSETLIAPNFGALKTKLERLISKGQAAVPVLNPQVMLASRMWLEWHRRLNFTSSTTWSSRTVSSRPRRVIQAFLETGKQLGRRFLTIKGAYSIRTKFEKSFVSSGLISSLLEGRLLKIDISERHHKMKDELTRLCASLNSLPLVEAVAFTSPDFLPMQTLHEDEHPLAAMFTTLTRASPAVAAVSIGVKVVLQDGLQTQVAFPFGPSYIPRVQRGDMCLIFVPALFRINEFCAQLERTLESSISEGWVAKTLGEMTHGNASRVATIQKVRYSVNISSPLIYPCNSPNVLPQHGRLIESSTASLTGGSVGKATARRLMTRDILQIGQPSPSVILPGISPGREYSCNLVPYVDQQSPNFCTTPGGAIQYCCAFPATCAETSPVPRCSDDIVATPPFVVLPGVIPGKEYSCAQVPYVNSHSPNFCNTPNGATQYCCAFPTTCADTSNVPRCSNDPPSALPTQPPAIVALPGATLGKEYSCANVPYIDNQSPNYCNTANGNTQYCCAFPSTCSPASDIPRCSNDVVEPPAQRTVVLPGAIAGQEYACGEVPYSQGQSPNYCVSSTFQQFCCEFPTNCVLSSPIPACA